MLIAFNKPYGIISQFTPDGSSHATLAEFDFPPRVYALGRLDADSEGLLLLTDEPALNSLLLHPSHGHQRRYLVQVEDVPDSEDLRQLEVGVTIRGVQTKPCRARLMDPPPQLPERAPPIRVRRNIPVSWIELQLGEGRNRQVRRMTAAIGHPTLRLIRIGIGGYRLHDLEPGQWIELGSQDRRKVFAPRNRQ